MAFLIIATTIGATAIFYFVMRDVSDTTTEIVDVIGVVDGRTVEIMKKGSKERVILAGVGFPPSDQKSQSDCFDIVQDMAVGRRLYMEVYKEVEGCKYVALKSSNGDNLNGILLSKGLARYESTGIGFLGELVSAENEARIKHIGVWDKNRSLYRHLTNTMNGANFGRAEDIEQFEPQDS